MGNSRVGFYGETLAETYNGYMVVITTVIVMGLSMVMVIVIPTAPITETETVFAALLILGSVKTLSTERYNWSAGVWNLMHELDDFKNPTQPSPIKT